MERLAGCRFADSQGLTKWAGLLKGKIGWGGRIRTSTILINSEVSYRLDHAPAAFGDFDDVGVARM
jgi:hypothetical protein